MAVRQVRVGDILSLHRVPVQIDEADSYRQIGLYSWGKGFIHRPSCLGFELSKLRYFQIPAGALVLSSIQAWEAAIAVSTNAEAEFIGSNRFLSYVPRTDDVDVRYLLHYFLSEPGLHQIKQASPGTQVRNRTLGQQLFERLAIPLPDVTEQQCIAARLDRIVAISTSFGEPPTAALRDNFLDRVSQRSRIGHIITLARHPVSVKASEAYPNLGILNRARGVFAKPPMLGLGTKYSTLYRVRAGQLIYSKLFGREGSLAIVPEWADGWFVSSEFPTFDVNTDAVDLDYFGQVLRWRGLAEQLAAATSGMGQRRQRVQIDQFEALEVPLPDLPTQRHIGADLLRLAAVEGLVAHRATLSAGLLPAARNQAFASLT
ncbi:MAG: restriction endonuclease subunit S [Candidatus Nanopelagicales bacterium]|nr:restriction endonuclease subunit S [Candidatus Nanopelagicales bacterium]MDZ4249306.1 restriction endonuclease subunit S [Candidatus Nanopelagicales bacterium]